MRRHEIKSHVWIELRNGDICSIITNLELRGGVRMPWVGIPQNRETKSRYLSCCYRRDLTSIHGEEMDVVRVIRRLGSLTSDLANNEVLWER